jgi:DNA-binding NarL/FixJ family response regulator
VLPRFAEPTTLRTTVRSVLAGNDLLQSWGSDQTDRPALRIDPHAHDLVGALTVRELEVLDCLLMGHSTKETGSALGIADQTVKNRVSGILHKLHVDGRMGAIRLALSRGWAEYGPGPRVGPIEPESPGKSMPARSPHIEMPIPPTMPRLHVEQARWS